MVYEKEIFKSCSSRLPAHHRHPRLHLPRDGGIGGRGKKTPYEGLARELYLRAGAVILTGETLGEVSDALDSVASEFPESELKILCEEDFAACVRLAASITPAGRAVVLSPAATSFDKFKNFAERGEVFKSLVKNL